MDYTVGDTIRKCFTTRAFATGVPTVLAGTPVLSVYEDGSTTQITAGVSVTVDLDSVVGLNQLVIVATGGNGFDSGSDYSVVITTGTVGGVSVVGETVYTFSLGRSAAFTRLGAPAGASVSVDIADLPTVSEFNARTLVAASYFDPAADAVANVTLVATTTTNTDMRGTDSAALASVVGTPSDFGSGTSTIAANLEDLADDGTASYDRSTDSQQAIRDRGDAAWTTGSGTGLTALASGTAQGGSSSTIQLASGETFANSEPNGNVIKITAGTGAGQSRVILSYVGSTDTATVSPNWTTAPDATSVYEMVDGSANITAVSNVAEDIATATSIAALNDVAATDIVSAGAITTLSGAIVNVDLVDTTTTNTDMRGTDSALLAASINLTAGAVDNVTLVATTTTNTDMRGTDGVDTATMRGTDSAALASVATEARLAELDAGNLPATTDNILTDTGTTLPAQITAIFTTQMTEAYAADGVAPTPAQALFMIQQILGDFSIAGTVLTVRQLDGSTTAATYTLNDATTPTALTRAT